MTFLSFFHKNALYIAAEKGDIEMIKLLLSNPKVDINFQSVFDNYKL